MVGKSKKIVLAFILAVFVPFFCAAQSGQKDSLIRLVKGASLQIITDNSGKAYRKAVDATFLHNGTYLICDTAFWRVDDNIVNAIGHVQLIQEGTKLTSNLLDYYVNDDLARFRGGVVQLNDEENNTLRTMELDYNTRDSVAVFSKGGAMKDKDGQVIESLRGTYDSKAKLFTFSENVNMFTDSVFIRTEKLDYHSDTQKAVFPVYIDFWKDKNMLSASRGWYNRAEETFFFTGRVHGTTEKQESWSDSLYFYRNTGNVLMLSDAQVQDSVHNTSALADVILYEDSLSQVTMMKEAAVAIVTGEEASRDTVYFGADTLIYYTLPMCDIPDDEKQTASKRLEEILFDPVAEFRRKAAEEAANAAAEKAASLGGGRPVRGGTSAEGDTGAAGSNTDAAKNGTPADADAVAGNGAAADIDAADTEASGLPSQTDTLAQADSLTPPAIDSTKVGFAIGKGNVKVFRYDMQVRCDSMRYCDLDSIARLYKDPIVWNEGRRQYTADSLFALIRDGRADRASLQGNAFIATQEDTVHYDQIKGAEVLAYFDSTSALSRFDALGGSNALFYLEEKGSLATVNKVECKMLSSTFRDGDLDRVQYFESPKNDAYPLAQFPREDYYMKGFDWRPELCPSSRDSITTLQIRPSQRMEYAAREKTSFSQTDRFFPGYMKGVYREISAAEDARMRARYAKSQKENDASGPDALEQPADSIPAAKDSIDASAAGTASADSLLNASDSLTAASDSLAGTADSLASGVKNPTLAEKMLAKKALRDSVRNEKWARLDSLEAEKQALRDEVKQARVRERERKEIIRILKKQKEEDMRLRKYINFYERKKNGKDRKQVPALRSSGHQVG